MKFNGKKFSELILEQGKPTYYPVSKGTHTQAGRYHKPWPEVGPPYKEKSQKPTKPMPNKKGPGWKESEGGEWVWDEKTNDWIWELPEITVTARSDKHRVVIQISDDGKVEDVKIGV